MNKMKDNTRSCGKGRMRRYSQGALGEVEDAEGHVELTSEGSDEGGLAAARGAMEEIATAVGDASIGIPAEEMI